MPFDAPSEAPLAAAVFTSADVVAILRERDWLDASRDVAAGTPLEKWCARAADLLGPQAADRAGLADLLALVFAYDARALVSDRTNQAILAREGARDVIRELANRVLADPLPADPSAGARELDSDRLKEIIDGMKTALPYRGRELFFPLRLALAGRAGDGDLDRVILLLDFAAALDFATTVKGARQRMIEFCAAFD